jgi:hypothetical protein
MGAFIILKRATAFLLVAAAAAGAQTGPRLEYAGSALWSKAYDVRVDGRYFYCAFLNGLAILEGTDSTNPKLVSLLYLGGGSSLEVRGGLGYIAAGKRGLDIIDVSDPAAPVLRGSCPVESGEAKDIAVEGNWAYVAAGEGGLQVFDVTDPAAPKLAGLWNSPGSGTGVSVRGDLAYLADGDSGIAVVSVKDPARPNPIGTFDTEGTAEQIAVSGKYAFIADGTAGLRVIDIGTPAAPRPAASFRTSGYCHSVSCDGTRLAVGNIYDGAAQLLDVSDPANPILLATQKYTMYNEAWRVKLRGDKLTVVDHFSGLYCLDVSDMKKIATSVLHATPSSIIAIASEGTTAFAVGEITGINSLDISDPARPQVAGANGLFRGVNGLALAGGRAFMTDRWSVRVFDVADPAKIRGLKPFQVAEGVPRAIVVRGPFAYVTADKFGLYILDVSNPAGPSVAGTLKMPGFSYGLAVEDGAAFIANSDTGFHIVDVRDPAAPWLIGSLKVEGEPYGVAVRDGRAYVAAGPAGFLVLDVTNRDAPRRIGSLETDDFAYAVVLNGNDAYVADGAGGVRMIDISDPARPKTTSVFDTPGDAQGLALAGRNILVADSYSLMILRPQGFAERRHP